MSADKILPPEQLLHDTERKHVGIKGELAAMRGHRLEFTWQEGPDVDAGGGRASSICLHHRARRRSLQESILATCLVGSSFRGREDQAGGALSSHDVGVARLA